MSGRETTFTPDTSVSEVNDELDKLWHGHAALTRTTNQSVVNSTQQTLLVNSVVYDSEGMANAAGFQIDITVSGIYLVHAQVAWANNTSGHRKLEIRENNAPTVLATARREASGSASGVLYQEVSAIASLSEGDFIEAEVWQSSGASLNCQAITNYPKLSVSRLGIIA